MLKVKISSVMVVMMSMMTFAGVSTAQTTTTSMDATSSVLSRSLPTVQSADASHALPVQRVKTRRVKRIDKPVPIRATVRGTFDSNVYSRTINARTQGLNPKTRFVYKTRRDNTQTPIYFSEESLKSR
jgi:hypothetical protein